MDKQQQVTGGLTMALVKVQGRGQVTIPAKFREALDIETGYTLMLQQTGERRFTVEVIPRRTLADFPTFDVDVDMEHVREQMGQDIADRVYPRHDPREVLDMAQREAAATQEA